MEVYLCEKPSQATDLAKVLCITGKGDGFIGDKKSKVVTWVYGHLLELYLPDDYDEKLKQWRLEDLPIFPNPWKSQIKRSAFKQYKVIQSLFDSASRVYIATDFDREGEAVARTLLEKMQYKGDIKRVCLTSLDTDSIKHALSTIKDGHETVDLYMSALGRMRADWLVGMNLSRLYTVLARNVGYRGTLHIGRVLIPTVFLVCERDHEIANFQPHPYWLLQVTVSVQSGQFKATLEVPSEWADDKGRCINKTFAEQVAQQIHGTRGVIAFLEEKSGTESAPLPFHITSLQQYANRQWGYTSAEVLEAAQALYEKHKATTYPRTDSRWLPESQRQYVHKILQALMTSDPDFSGVIAGADANATARVFDDKKMGKSSHHAIIPTAVNVDLSAMSEIERNLYDAIRRFYVAQFYRPFEFLRTNVKVEAAGHRFSATGKVPISHGWKMVLTEPDTSDEDAQEPIEADQGKLPSMRQGEPAMLGDAAVQDKVTKAPPHYTEASLLAAMENIARFVDDGDMKTVLKETSGIGTSATRAEIIEGAVSKGYLKRSKRKLIATPKAFSLIAVVPADVRSPVMTASWEQQLEEIANGDERLSVFMERIQKWLEHIISTLKQAAPALTADGGVLKTAFSEAIEEQHENTFPCFTCGSELRRRKGKFGFFWSCTNRECKGTFNDARGKPARPITEEESPECPDCGGSMRLRKGKKADSSRTSKFWGCTRFPECKGTLPYKKTSKEDS